MRKSKVEGGATAPGAPPAVIPTGATAVGEDPHLGLEETVATYLRGHADFFAYHPDVLTGLQVPHSAAGKAVSLIEHQVRMLRTQLDTERGRLAQLIARAREYEAFSTRLHALVLALIAAPDLAHVCGVLQEGLMREFSAQAVTLKLFPLDAADGGHDPLVVAFRDFLGRRHALCGPLDEAKNGALFGAPADPQGALVRCAALIPIRTEGRCGVLAIGAADPDRFKPDMRTDLLDRLGEVVSQKLQVLPAETWTTPSPPPGPAAPGADAAPKAKPKAAPRKRTKKTVPE